MRATGESVPPARQVLCARWIPPRGPQALASRISARDLVFRSSSRKWGSGSSGPLGAEQPEMVFFGRRQMRGVGLELE
eukprot:14427727-Alexandrium_andersonii.AAC.1